MGGYIVVGNIPGDWRFTTIHIMFHVESMD